MSVKGLERRVEALEESANPEPIVVISVKYRADTEEALKKHIAEHGEIDENATIVFVVDYA